MQETVDRQEIIVNVQFSNGNEYNQPLEIDSDGAQEFMDWFRDSKGSPVWSWQVPSCQRIHMFHRIHIAAVDISGYIEPEFNKTRWYERIAYKIHSFLIIRKTTKGGDSFGENSEEAERRQAGQGNDQEVRS